MRIVVTGATGTIGRALVRELLAHGHAPVALSRDPDRARASLPDGVEVARWGAPKEEPPPLAGADAVVHLLGEPIAQRWTEAAKREIRDSRVLSTRRLVAAMREAPQRPAVLVSQSGVGFYAPRGDEPVDESAGPGSGFESEITRAWEAEARAAEELGVRVTTTRMGVVLSESGGALEKMLPPFKAGVGGPVAGGRQHVSWVHLDDAAGALRFCVEDERARGPVNVTAPNPVTNAELSKALGRVLKRPAVLPVPAFALKVLYGEMSVIVTGGARALPAKLLELGYDFRRPELDDALREATGRA